MFDFPHPEFAIAILALSVPMLWAFASLAFDTARLRSEIRDPAVLASLSSNFDRAFLAFFSFSIVMNGICLAGLTSESMAAPLRNILWMPSLLAAMAGTILCRRALTKALSLAEIPVRRK